MRFISYALFVTASLLTATAATFAADMTGAEIKTFLSNKTTYSEATAASASGVAGQVVIFWSADGTALYKTPTGSTLHGKWETVIRRAILTP